MLRVKNDKYLPSCTMEHVGRLMFCMQQSKRLKWHYKSQKHNTTSTLSIIELVPDCLISSTASSCGNHLGQAYLGGLLLSLWASKRLLLRVPRDFVANELAKLRGKLFIEDLFCG